MISRIRAAAASVRLMIFIAIDATFQFPKQAGTATTS
jgi:hypothetical protein